MAAVIPEGRVEWGIQLPVQAQSRVFAQDWEASGGPEDLALLAQSAERAGALYVGVCDHIAIPEPADQTMSGVWYDAVATLAWLGARTESILLLSHVYVAAYRHPLMIAKSFGTLDVLSGGRTILGLGAGHLEREFQVLGVDFAGRGRAVEDAVPLIRAALADGRVTVGTPDGDATVLVAPSLRREGGLPIWVGGSSKVAIRRAALLADGWLPQGPPKIGMSAAIEFIRETRSATGLSAQFDIGVTGGAIFIGAPDFDLPEHTLSGSNEELVDRLARFTSKGVNQLQLQFLGRDVQQVCDQMERFGDEVAPLLRSR